MNDDRLSRLESRLEQWVETTFAAAFGYKVNVFDLALYLVRALEEGLRYDPTGINRPLAPDSYVLQIAPDLYHKLIAKYPDLAERLCAYLITLASQADYRFSRSPSLRLIAQEGVAVRRPLAFANHSDDTNGSTLGLTAVTMPLTDYLSHKPHLILNGGTRVDLDRDIINVGRMVDNDVVVDDPYVSRYHAQIRRRGNEFLLFDINSSRGTSVNGIRVREHLLRSGDVIDIGRSRLIYIDDRPDDDNHHSPPTDTLEGL